MTIRIPSKLALVLLLATTLAVPATAQDRQFKYLLPAPATLPAFSFYHVAKLRGYYADAGLDVEFFVAKGGADVAKQVAVGNAPLGNAAGDTSIIVRPNGLKVKGVALLGGRALTQIVTRDDAGVTDFGDLKGKRIGVMSFQDTTYYNLLAVLASEGLGRDDVSIEAVGPAGIVQLMISGDLDAISGTPDWAYAIEQAGVPVTSHSINSVFPSMTQDIVASDALIEEDPELIRSFVGATLHGLRDVIDDPAGCASLLAAEIPAFNGKEAELEEVMKRYARLVYAVDEPADLGRFDPKRVELVRDFYKDNGIVREVFPVDDYFTNAFVGGH